MSRVVVGHVIFWLCVAAIAAFFVFGMYMSITQTIEFTAKCHATDGVPVRAKSGLVCLSPAAVKEIGD